VEFAPVERKTTRGVSHLSRVVMSGLWPEKKPNGSWSYPCLVDVLEKAGLKTITHYMGVRQQTVANFIIN
jgi:hypothetical protein